MYQFICASLSHTHYSYEVGMLKVPYMLSITLSTLYVHVLQLNCLSTLSFFMIHLLKVIHIRRLVTLRTGLQVFCSEIYCTLGRYIPPNTSVQ